MKKILLLAVPLLLAAAGGGFFLLGGDKAVGAKAAPEATALDKPRYYYELSPITATIFRADQPAGVFTAAVTLEIGDEAQRADIFRAKDRLRDAMFRELHAMYEREEFTGRAVSIDAVKDRMLMVSRRVLGADVVLDVFVNTLMREGT